MTFERRHSPFSGLQSPIYSLSCTSTTITTPPLWLCLLLLSQSQSFQSSHSDLFHQNVHCALSFVLSVSSALTIFLNMHMATSLTAFEILSKHCFLNETHLHSLFKVASLQLPVFVILPLLLYFVFPEYLSSASKYIFIIHCQSLPVRMYVL